MLTYTVEPLTPEWIAETRPLQATYWSEVAGPFHDFPPDVNWTTYLSLQAQGGVRLVCGRDDAGTLQAGAVLIIGPHPHYACIAASMPLLFVHPDFRKGGEGLRLLRRAEQVAEESGAQLIMTHGGIHNGVYRIFESRKYADFGRYFVKVLPHGPHGLAPVFKGAK